MSSNIFDLIEKEKQRQHDHIELIASENFTSENVLKATGSILTNKYAEGYPYKRYYGGCDIVDQIEINAIEGAKKLFNVSYANVQPHSGSSANLAVFKALLKPKDRILSMSLDHGGHLTHGHPANFSGQDYKVFTYGVDKKTGMLDYDSIERLAIKKKPRIIIAGYSAYSRIIDFKRFREIADRVKAYLLVDMAHIAGLVATGLHPSPTFYADVITSTTHKTLRGPRGGIILTNRKDLIKKINSAIFPGTQGGPLMHVIAGKAIAFEEAMKDSFKKYQKQVIKNAFTLSEELKKLGYKIVSNSTENHLLVVNVKDTLGITGKQAQFELEKVNITCNKNTIPNDKESPFVTSGIRLGTPAMTTRGFKEKEIKEVAKLIDKTLRSKGKTEEIKQEVLNLVSKFPLHEAD